MPNIDPYTTWFQTSWRPLMAYQYGLVCLFDFMLAPILMGLYSVYTGEFHAWEPLTIRGGGMYHLAMAPVLGVAVWSRGQEKLAMLNTDKGDDPDDKATCEGERK